MIDLTFTHLPFFYVFMTTDCFLSINNKAHNEKLGTISVEQFLMLSTDFVTKHLFQTCDDQIGTFAIERSIHNMGEGGKTKC